MNAVEYDVASDIETIWANIEKILPYTKNWILNQRWIEKIPLNDCILIDKERFLLYQSDTNLIIGFIVQIQTEKEDHFEYFIPLNIIKSNEKRKKFPIVLKCGDGTLYIGPAELNSVFFEQIVLGLTGNLNIHTANSDLVQFQALSTNLTNFQNFLSAIPLGGGDTTNTLYKTTWSNNSTLVFKIFRRLSQNPEIKMLHMLYAQGFHNIPAPLGSVILKINNQAYPLILISEYIESKGDGGIFFWNDVKSQLNNWQSSNELETHQLNIHCQRLGQIVAELHSTSSQIDDEFFRPEFIIEDDIKKWKFKLENLIHCIIPHIRKELSPFLAIRAHLNYFETHINQILLEPLWKKLEGNVKIKIHQDLHLAQLLATDSSNGKTYFILDFEGDPLLTTEEKSQKDPVFRDLAGIFTAFHYITLNALKNYFSRFNDLKKAKFKIFYLNSMESIINSSASSEFPYSLILRNTYQWKKYCQDLFLRHYLHHLKRTALSLKINPDSKTSFFQLFKLFAVERFVKELYYETLFRKYNIFIPFTGLLEILKRDFF